MPLHREVTHAKLYLLRGRLVVGDRARLRSSSFAAAACVLDRLAEPKLAERAKAGGARRDRTDDLLLAKQALSQLSYGP